MKQIALMVLAALALTPAWGATLYKWTDKNGVVHYSDQPHKGAKPVDLPGLSRFSAPSPPPQSSNRETAEPADAFSQFVISTPAPQGTVQADNGQVPVHVALKPPLQGSQRLVYTLDGQRVGTTASTSITLTNVVRGTHTLNVSVVNGSDETVASAPAVTFHVRHHSALSKKNPANQFPQGSARNNNAFQFPRGKNPPL